MTERQPIPKRVRYEVLRRDNFTCRYCGRTPPEVKLTLDHVVPDVLGGQPVPSNLVAACTDCNLGKSSSPPDAPIVEDVAQDALRWATAMKTAHAAARQTKIAKQQHRNWFRELWESWTYRGLQGQQLTVELPADWQSSVDRFTEAGIDMEDFEEAIRIAMTSKTRDEFRYMCGVIWRWIAERQEMARQILTDGGE